MNLTPVERLLAGFRGFRAIYYEQRPERMRLLAAGGQKPAVLVVACSDSRVDPAIVTNAEPGELFIVRNVANLVPPYAPAAGYHGTSAAIEYAVRDLKVSDIVVLGHSLCGGIRALIRGRTREDDGREFIGSWVGIAGDAFRTGSDEAAVEREAIRVSLTNLRGFPWVNEGVEAGRLSLHGWWFDVEKGELWGIGEPSAEFRRLV